MASIDKIIQTGVNVGSAGIPLSAKSVSYNLPEYANAGIYSHYYPIPKSVSYDRPGYTDPDNTQYYPVSREGLPGYADSTNRFYYPTNTLTTGQSDMAVDQTDIPSIPVPLNAGSNSPIASTGFDNSVANAEKMILNGSLGNGKKVRRDAWLALGGSAEAYEQAQANINKRFASKAVRRNTNISSKKSMQQEAMARKAQQDELLRQSMLRSAQQNPNSSVRANIPDYYNSSTTMQQYYLNNPDLWR